jgi:hypothetical protein
MSPIKYQKPVLIDLSSAAHSAAGTDPSSCYDGASPGGFGICGTGTSGGDWGQECTTGRGAVGVGGGMCIAGPGPFSGYCINGGGGDNYGDSCTSGPGVS